MIMHNRDDLIAAGFVHTGFQLNMASGTEVPGWGKLRKVAIALDCKQDCLWTVRTSGVSWDVFYVKTGRVDGFEDVGLLPKVA